jgi:hypothetical protein
MQNTIKSLDIMDLQRFTYYRPKNLHETNIVRPEFHFEVSFFKENKNLLMNPATSKDKLHLDKCRS